VQVISPLDRELARAAAMKVGLGPMLVRLIELPVVVPGGKRVLPDDATVQRMLLALTALTHLLRSRNYRDYIMQLGMLPRVLTLVLHGMDVLEPRPDLLTAALGTCATACSIHRSVQTALQRLKAPYIVACLLNQLTVYSPLFLPAIQAFNASLSSTLTYADVVSTTNLYHGANSVETLKCAVEQSTDKLVRANAVEALGKMCGTHVGMCQLLKDADAVQAFVNVLDIEHASVRELRGKERPY
jgi:hypothetical protein